MILETAKNIVDGTDEALIIAIVDSPEICYSNEFKLIIDIFKKELDTTNVLTIYYKDLPDDYKKSIDTRPSFIGFEAETDFDNPTFFQEGLIINEDG